ncbi:MAG TPA: O-antigen ligase family protein [Desulfobacteraceae bacterium]|nr:O-antigen ligase family protein [Desulfobacteraceae bacterium]
MPPILALTLCTIFVLFILKLDREQYPEASLALWVPTVWMLMNATKPLAIWFGAGGVSMEEGSALDRNVLIVLAVLGFMILSRRRLNWSNAIKENGWVFAVLGFMFISVGWSDMPFVSFKRWIRVMIAVIMAFVVATETSPIDALKCIIRRSIYILIPLSYVLIHYYPHLGREYNRWSGGLMWTGVASQKNGLTALCLIALFFLVWTFVNRRRTQEKPATPYQKYVELFLLMLALLLFAGPNHTLKYSATSTGALAAGLFLFGGMLWLKRRNIIPAPNTLSLLIGSVIVLGTIIPFTQGFLLSDVAFLFDRSSTLTDRTDIWAQCIHYAMKKPLLGYGFGGFWNDAMRSEIYSDAHNGYLGTILNIGFVGLIFFSMYFINSARQAGRMMHRNFEWGCLWICLLLMALLHNMTESSQTSFTGFSSALLLFLLVTGNAINNHKNVKND